MLTVLICIATTIIIYEAGTLIFSMILFGLATLVFGRLGYWYWHRPKPGTPVSWEGILGEVLAYRLDGLVHVRVTQLPDCQVWVPLTKLAQGPEVIAAHVAWRMGVR